ncbi:MAG: alpha/beta fold hydrolase [Patescibacteria group bacterium]
MKTTLHRIVTKDHLELVGLLYEPDNGSKEILVHVHGMAGNFYENKFLDYIAKTLTDSGVAFFTFNNRGCEYIKDITRIEGDRRYTARIGDTFEKFEDCILDIEAAINFVHNKNFSEIHLSGHSLGSPKTAYYISNTKDHRIKSLLFLSPADMVGLAIADKNFEKDMKLANGMIEQGKGDEVMPTMVWGESYLSADTFVNLASKKSKVAIFNLYDKDDKLEVLSTISIPTIVMMGKRDGALTVPVEQLMERIKKALKSSSKVETVVLGEANHGYDGYEQKPADEINQWIQKM